MVGYGYAPSSAAVVEQAEASASLFDRVSAGGWFEDASSSLGAASTPTTR